MNELGEYRNDITRIDRQMAALFEERMHISEKVAAYKQQNGLPVRSREVEAEIIASQRERIEDEKIRYYYELFLQSVMAISSSYQEQLTGKSEH